MPVDLLWMEAGKEVRLMSFARWIHERRESKKLTMVECAERAGVKQPVWSDYENEESERQFRRATVLKIARALDVDADEALVAAGLLTPDMQEPDAEITRMVYSLDPKKRELLVRAVADLVDYFRSLPVA